MERRRKLLEQLSQTKVGLDWGFVSDGYFRLLYKLPTELQIELACFMMYRYLPIFEHREPNIKWPRRVLEDVTQCFSLPRDGQFEYPSDSVFYCSFNGLTDAYRYRDNPYKVTSSCLYAVKFVINARRNNVWAADDPEAVEIDKREMEKEQREIYLEQERLPSWNIAAIAVAQREWQEVAKWGNNKQVWMYPDNVNLEEMEKDLEYWASGAYLL